MHALGLYPVCIFSKAETVGLVAAIYPRSGTNTRHHWDWKLLPFDDQRLSLDRLAHIAQLVAGVFHAFVDNLAYRLQGL